MWRSLVAHLHGVQGVEGSNPFTPTTTKRRGLQVAILGGLFHWEIMVVEDKDCRLYLAGFVLLFVEKSCVNNRMAAL